MKKKSEPKPMKPVKAWAHVDKMTNEITYLNIGMSKEKALKCARSNERIARILITEVKR